MYSMVMLMALGNGIELPDCHRRRHGCMGGSYGGYAGAGCMGGYGGCSGGGYGGGYAPSYGCGGGYAPAYGCGGGYAAPPDGRRPRDADMKEAEEESSIQAKVQELAPARLVVRLPADARLVVNGKTSQSMKPVRTFVTPPLAAGRAYTFTLNAQVSRDGEEYTATRKVSVRAGQRSEVAFTLTEDSVAQR